MNAVASLPKEIIDMLRAIAQESRRANDREVVYRSSDDPDAMFTLGEETGRIDLARDLCDALGISCTTPEVEE